MDGYFKDSSTGICEQCKYPCSTCSSSATVCLSWAEGRLLEGNSCNNYCSYPCLTCKNTVDQCETCYEGFVASGTTCIQCPTGCKTCEVEGESSVCTSCLDGYYKDGEECHQCSSPCATCFSSNTYNGCYSCETGYFMDKIFTYPAPYVGKCSECKTKTEHCIECSTECIDDDLDSSESCHNFKCTKCEGGYFATEENGASICSPCPDNCLTCSNSKTCTRCQIGFMLEGNECKILDFCSNEHCVVNNTDGTNYADLTLPSEIKSFTNSESPTSGGAIRMINIGLTADNVTFNTCSSQQGGGAIFIYNNIISDNAFYTIKLTNLVFKGCSATFGSAVYIYSPIESCTVEVKSCIFDSNKIIPPSTSKLTGGALYITAKSADVSDCSFKSNKGRGGALKITDDFDILPENLRMLQGISHNYSRGSVVVSRCSFEIDRNSDSSLFYENERRLIKVEINDCSFTGKLQKGAHYISGKSVTRENPYISIRSCQFSADQQEAISNNFIQKAYLRNHVLINNEFYNEKVANKSIMMISSLVTVVLVIAMITIFKKRNNNANHYDFENENNESIEV